MSEAGAFGLAMQWLQSGPQVWVAGGWSTVSGWLGQAGVRLQW